MSGFTLLELLVSITIGAILLGVGVPGFNSVMRNSQQVSSANELLSSMHLARDLAITRNARVTMCPSGDSASCAGVSWSEGWLVFVDTDADGQVDADETIFRAVDEVGVAGMSTTQFGSRVTFRPNGRAMGATITVNTGEFMLCDERGAEHARVVIIDMSGRPRVSHERMDGSDPVCTG